VQRSEQGAAGCSCVLQANQAGGQAGREPHTTWPSSIPCGATNPTGREAFRDCVIWCNLSWHLPVSMVEQVRTAPHSVPANAPPIRGFLSLRAYVAFRTIFIPLYRPKLDSGRAVRTQENAEHPRPPRNNVPFRCGAVRFSETLNPDIELKGELVRSLPEEHGLASTKLGKKRALVIANRGNGQAGIATPKSLPTNRPGTNRAVEWYLHTRPREGRPTTSGQASSGTTIVLEVL